MMSSPTWPKQMNALLITLHSLLRGTWSDLTDPLPFRVSTWSIRSPLTTARTPRVASFFRVYKQPPLTGYNELEPEDNSGTASSSLPRVPLEALTPHDAQDDVTPVTESPMTPALRLIPRTQPPKRLCRLEH